MRLAFYAPLKPPDHPNPSGDRTMARALIAAWRKGGAEIAIASRFRARVGSADAAEIAKRAERGQAIAERLIRRYRQAPARERPDAWFTYHLYYKAPDWLGPRVAAALDIPYLVAEASHAPKRATGPYADNHRAVEAAIRRADAIFCLNPADEICLAEIVSRRRLIDLPPFLDLAKFRRHLPEREMARRLLARAHRLPRNMPWLIAVAMMRPGDKLASYRLLAEALGLLRQEAPNIDFRLILIGDGPARAEIARHFKPFRHRLRWAGEVQAAGLAAFYAAGDLLVWPAINEAFGMALLEAQAAGCPVIAGASGGVPAIIADGKTGFLTPPGSAADFADAIHRALTRDLSPLRAAAIARTRAHHDIAIAAERLGRTLRALGVGSQ